MLVQVSGPPPPSSASGSSSVCTAQTNPFSVTSSYWGKPGFPQAVYPGDQNVPLTMTLLFSGPCTAPQATLTLSLSQYPYPTPFVGPNGETQITNAAVGVTPDTFVTETYNVSVDSSATTGVTYSVPLDIQYANNTISSTITQVLIVPIALKAPVQLQFSASTTRLVAGEENNVTITISNTGSAASGSITTTVTPPPGVTLIGSIPKISGLQAESNVSELVQMFVPSSLSGTAVSVTFSADYLDAYSLNQTKTQSLGFVVYASVGSQAASFSVQGARWGAPAYPGGQNLLLTVTAEYYGGATATAVQGALQLPAGFTDVYGSSRPVASTTSVTSDTIFTLSYNLDVASGTALGTYTIPIVFTWTNAPGGAINTHVENDSMNLVVLGSVTLTARSLESTLTSGSVNSVQVVLTNLGSGTATQVLASASGVGVSFLAQPSIISSLDGGASATLNFTLYAPPSAAGTVVSATLSTTYTDAYGNPQALSQTLAFYVSSLSSNQIQVTTINGNVTEGQIGTVSFLIKNIGAEPITSPTFSLSLPYTLVCFENSSVTLQGLVIAPGSSARYDALVTNLNTTLAAGGVYAGSVSVSYTDSAGYVVSQTLPVSFVVSLPVDLVTMKQLTADVSVGGTSTVSFMITNEGNTALYSPSFSISLPASLALSANSSYSTRAPIKPGQSFVLYASVTNGPKTSEGSYPGTLTLSYTDQFGNARSMTFSIGLLAIASIEPVVQSEVVTQVNATSVSVSGTLLNEGQGSAYYAQVAATLSVGGSRIGNATSYVGEVDPNTPVPFSVTIPISASTPTGNGTVALSMSYQNDFGQHLALTSLPLVSVYLDSALLASQAASAAKASQHVTQMAGYLLPTVVVVVVVVLLLAFYVRRRSVRAGAKKKVI